MQLEVTENTLIAPITALRNRQTPCALGTHAKCIASYTNSFGWSGPGLQPALVHTALCKNRQTALKMHKNKHTHTPTNAYTVAGHCVLSGEFHQLFTRVRVGKFMTVLDKTINNITHTTLAHTQTHARTYTAELLSFMSCVFEDKEGAVHYIIWAK